MRVNVCQVLVVLRDKLQYPETSIDGRKRDIIESFRDFVEPLF